MWVHDFIFLFLFFFDPFDKWEFLMEFTQMKISKFFPDVVSLNSLFNGECQKKNTMICYSKMTKIVFELLTRILLGILLLHTRILWIKYKNFILFFYLI